MKQEISDWEQIIENVPYDSKEMYEAAFHLQSLAFISINDENQRADLKLQKLARVFTGIHNVIEQRKIVISQ